MKNIIIIGTPRSGKTTLANMLYGKIKCQIIHGDCERLAIDLTFPELHIKENKNFCKYLEILIRKQHRDNKYKYPIILESTDINPEDIDNYFNKDNNIIICLGTTLIDYKKYAEMILKNDTKLDWTYKYSKEQIEEYTKEYIQKSKENLEECKKRNIKFIDTSIEREKVLNNLLNIIINDIKY